MKPGGNYNVGYGKPPVHTRFKKGKTGNRNGRPKQRLSVRDELLKAANKKVALPDGTKVTKFYAGMKQLRLKALKGDLVASSLIEQIEETIARDPATNPVRIFITEWEARIF
jgi:hypothetical protein